MANAQDNSGSLEALRIQIERVRLGLDETRAYLERWRTDLQPVHEHRLKSRDHGYGFAKLAIQTMYLLNGGALIFFPAFAQLVGSEFRQHLGLAVGRVGAFVVGLILIAITTVFWPTSPRRPTPEPFTMTKSA